MLADQVAQPLSAVVSQHGPELQGTKATAESRAVVLQVDGRIGRGEVLGRKRERLMEHLGPACPQRCAIHLGEEPLVRIDDDGIGALDPVEAPAKLGADGRRPRIRRVDVEPRARLPAPLGELRHGVDRRGSRRADRRDDRRRIVERKVSTHAVRLVDFDGPELEADEPRGLLDAEVRLLRCVDDAARPKRAGRCERGDGRRRCGVLDMAVPRARQAEQLREPVHHGHFQLGGGG